MTWARDSACGAMRQSLDAERNPAEALVNRQRQSRDAIMDEVPEAVGEVRHKGAAMAVVASNEISRPDLRHDWSASEVKGLLALPFSDLVFRAQLVHRRHWDANRVQMSTLLSIKTGRCPEDCAYCPESVRYDTGVGARKLIEVEAVGARAKRARTEGVTRHCMGAAWRSPKDRDLDALCAMVKGVKALGMETCMTLGMLSDAQARRLADAGLDYYNHNLDSSEAFYAKIITTRTYRDRLHTLARVRDAGMKICCGGIVGLGESRRDRAESIATLANLPVHPEIVPINMFVQIKGTPLYGTAALDPFEYVRTVAAARITMPRSVVRLGAGREQMSDETQALAFLAGANSVFVGPVMLTDRYTGLACMGVEFQWWTARCGAVSE